MPTAALLARARSLQCIRDGLAGLGYGLTDTPKVAPDNDDILVLWNRLATTEDHAKRYEDAGCKVIVTEHGWIGEKTYAVALSQHNGAGHWHIGEETRWPSFGIDVRPWRNAGDHILVVPQRGIGSAITAMPRDWTEKTLTFLKQITNRPIRVRNPKHRRTPIEPEFQDAHCVITWASGAGIKALVHGIPVFYEMPSWIGAPAAKLFKVGDLEDPYLGDRTEMLHRLSWGMWHGREVASGEPFRCVLQL